MQIAELPQYAEIFFMHADRVGDLARLAVPVVAPCIEIMHIAETIAAERQGIEKLPNTVFARVEGIAAKMSPCRIAIGNDHFGKRGTMDDRPELSFVLIADAMEE